MMNKLKKFFHKSISLNKLISFISFYAEHVDYLRKAFPKRMTVKDLTNVKSSGTLFILGSGESINNLSADDWDEINQHDSMALNRWYKSNFVPTIWMWEPPKDEMVRENDFSEMMYLLENKDCFKILKNWHHLYSFYQPKRAKNIALKFDAVVMTRRTHIYNPRQMQQLKKYIKSHYFHFYRGSLFLAICIARLAGYKKVILCGVDLSGGYFYDSGPLSGNNVHNTAVEKNGISMKDALFRLKSIMLEEGIILDTHETCKFKLS